MVLDGLAKKDEVDPEEIARDVRDGDARRRLQPINIDVPVEQALQALPGVSMAGGAAEGPVQNILQEVARRSLMRSCSPTSRMT